MCEHLEAVTAGQIRNLVITIPPGSTKSITVNVAWPAWTWTKKPGIRWLMASNGDDLVTRDAVACRRLLQSQWFIERWGHVFRLTSDQNVKLWYENDKRGYRTGTTAGSNSTGKKGDILVGDDLNDAKKVESEAERLSVNDWWDKSFFNRVNNHVTGQRVVIGQRTHEDDAIGHILKNGGFVHLNIPEEFKPARRTVTVLGNGKTWSDWRKNAGELMRPERFGPEQVKEARARLGSRGYEAQHNQNPAPTEGSLFKAAWFRYYHLEEDYYLTLGQGGKRYHLDTLANRFLTVDTAATVKKTAKHDPDFTVISAWCITPCGMLLWFGCYVMRLEVPDIHPQVAKRYLWYGAQIVDVEAGGTQKSCAQFCRRYNLSTMRLEEDIRKAPQSARFMNVVEFVPNTDKLDTAHAALVAMESGRVWFPQNGSDRICLPREEAPFPLAEVEGQLLRFTGGKQDAHDDIVDTLSSAAKRLTRMDDVKPARTAFRSQSRGPVQRLIR